jgi:hypothetical protein
MENREYHAVSFMCLSISTNLCFLEEQLSVMINPLRENRIRVDTMPNSLLRKINSLRSRYHALRLAKTKYIKMIVSIGILFILIEYD